MKRFWTWIKSISMRKWWFLILLIGSSIYVYHYRFNILDFSTIDAQDLIFFIWLILILLPLFSEIEVLGVKVKKEIEKSVQEVKDSITELRLQVVASNASASSNQTMNLYTLSLEQMKALAKPLESLGSDAARRGESSAKTDTKVNTKIPEQVGYLFTTRYILQDNLARFDKLFSIDNKAVNSRTILNWLRTQGFLESETVKLIEQIFIIANRGVHGETIGEEYISFIKQIYPSIIEKLNTAYDALKSKKLFYFTCSRCQYRGNSVEENVCPNCGFTSDDY